MQPLVVVLLVILVIIIVLLVGRLVKTGGGFTNDGDYLEEEGDEAEGMYTIFDVRERIRSILDAEVDLISDDCTRNRWDFLMIKHYGNYAGMRTTIEQMRRIDSTKYSRIISIIHAYLYINKQYMDLCGEWNYRIGQSLDSLFVAYFGRNLIDENERRAASELCRVKPEQVTPEICNYIIRFIQEKDRVFNRAGTKHQNIIDELQAYLANIKRNKWTNILNYYITSSSGKRTKAALRRTSSYEDDEAEYRP